MTKGISSEREDSHAIYPAEMKTVGSHTRLDVDPAGDWIAKPVGFNAEMQATHIEMQALTQNIRYTIDGSPATATHGFQLAAGAISFIPVPNGGLSVYEEAAGAIIQYQFVR